MPHRAEVSHAASVLRGHAGVVHHDDVRAAGRVLVADWERLLRIEMWASRLVEADDPVAADRARRQLASALDG